MLKNEVVQTMSLNIKFSYLAENSKFSRSNSYFSILTPTFLRDGFLNSCFQNPSENSDDRHTWRSGMRSAMCAASQLSERGPTGVDVAPVPAR